MAFKKMQPCVGENCTLDEEIAEWEAEEIKVYKMTFEEIVERLPRPYYADDAVAIYCADCRDILPLIPDKSIDLVLTDPPYPDQHLEYGDCDISFLDNLTCRQLIFWTAKDSFPLHYTAIHIWDKQVGCASEYERIFERNGLANYKLFRGCSANNPITARFQHDIFTGHPSQKSQKLISKLIADFSKQGNLILDPFLGSGTTAYCAKKLGRKCIGIEIEEKYCEIAAKRCSQSIMRLEV
jgi:site-specific DNA-methyltransferase (adenine-specific)